MVIKNKIKFNEYLIYINLYVSNIKNLLIITKKKIIITIINVIKFMLINFS